MAGMQFKIDVDMVNPTARLDFDPILPLQGALMLVDPSHPYSPMAAGVPANLSYLPNLAWKQAIATIGGGAVEADVKPQWKTLNNSQAVAPTVSRTSKGGIYTSGQYAGPHHPAKIIDFLIANPTHDFFVSVWGRLDDAVNASMVSQLAKNGTVPASIAGEAYTLRLDGTGANPSGTRLGSRVASKVNGNFIFNGAFSSSNLSGATGAQFVSANGAVQFGTYGNLGSGARRSYRFYMEDLTVSGRAYAAVDAIDNAEYTKQVLTAGGRYYNDAIV
jgi:hypothetical protein